MVDAGCADERRGDIVAELSGLVWVAGVIEEGVLEELLAASPELEGARRSLGRSGSSSILEDELLEVLPELLVDELLTLSSELEDARRSFGRFGSLLPEDADPELPDEPLDELPEEPLDELADELFVMG